MKTYTANIIARNVLEAILSSNVSGEVAVFFLREALKHDARKDLVQNLDACLFAAAEHPTHAGSLITILLDDIIAEKATLNAEMAAHLLSAITKQDQLGRTPLHVAATISQCPNENAIGERYDACKKLLDVLEQADRAKKSNSIKGLTCQFVKDFYEKSGADFRLLFLKGDTSTEVSASYKDSFDQRQNVGETRVFENGQAQEIFDCLKSLGAIAAEPKNELLITEEVYDRAVRILEQYADGSIIRNALNQRSSDGRTVLGYMLDLEHIDWLKGVSMGREDADGVAVNLLYVLVRNGADINATWKHGYGTICEELARISCDNAVLLLVSLLRASKQ